MVLCCIYNSYGLSQRPRILRQRYTPDNNSALFHKIYHNADKSWAKLMQNYVSANHKNVSYATNNKRNAGHNNYYVN